MTHTSRLVLPFALLAGVLSACADDAPVTDATDTAMMDMTAGDSHSGHDMDEVMAKAEDPVITLATGRFMSVAANGTYATLDHDPIPAINMGAMRMGFDVDPTLDLSAYEEGDALLFRLVTSEETGFLITEVCRPATDGAACLAD